MLENRDVVVAGKDPSWYKDAIVYEVHVRAFHDSNADGIGDFKGLTEKLGYLQDLGVTAIWLLPFYPSPLKDDGYDIADCYSINPIYGTLDDFKRFLNRAHGYGLKVITELVVNHTSDQHPWFQRSRRAPAGSPWRDFYVWSDTAEKYKSARIIFRDFEPSNWTWDHVAHAYYWHRFYSHQPDLNYDNPEVHREILRVLDFWLDMGVDGLRLDAVPYLYEREATSCENLPETHAYLKTLRHHVDTKYGDRLLLAEANQWPEDAVSYFGSGKGDECHMAFHFPLMPRLFMAVRMEDRVPIVDILEQTPPIPETSQWAMFLRNHDELTLEMVTDEERDYMYRVYANDAKARINLGIRRRLAPLLGNDRRRIELLHLLLFSFPGTPFLYYGDEIGMGDNIYLGDRNGVRTPMQWSSDKNAGFSRATPQALYFPVIVDPEYHYEAVNVEAQHHNPHSLWWWMKRVLTLRKRFKAFSRGSTHFLQPENRKILAFIRRFEQETLLVVANLSRFAQPAKLDLAEFKNVVPIEIFGRNEFPVVSTEPYALTLSPHSAFWFLLEPAPTHPPGDRQPLKPPPLTVAGDWHEVLSQPYAMRLESRLVNFLRPRRWFGAKGRQIKNINVEDTIRLTAINTYLLLLQVEYVDGEPDEYQLPVSFGPVENIPPHAVITELRKLGEPGDAVMYDATVNKEFAEATLKGIQAGTVFPGDAGELRARSTSFLPPAEPGMALEPAVNKAEQSNSAIIYGDRLFLKLFRRVEPGVNPDLEIGRFLTRAKFPHTPQTAGWLEYVRPNGENLSFAILTEFFSSSKDAWSFTLDTLGRYFERVRTATPEALAKLSDGQSLLDLAALEMPEGVAGFIGTYVEAARLLGQRTGELHLALASDSEDRDFSPEPFTPFYQRSLYQSMRNLTVGSLSTLRRKLPSVPAAVRPQAQEVAANEGKILGRLHAIYEQPLSTKRIRCHGDYHLGQVLYTGKDFIIIDFEGEPARPVSERRIKRSPMRDVAGMIRSFDYVTWAAVFNQVELGAVREQDATKLEPWTEFWYRWVSATFLKAYLKVLAPSDLLPTARNELKVLLETHLLEKAVYELSYELNNRPQWLRIPVRGILGLLRAN